MKIFLTGATGGIGKSIKSFLEKKNIEVIDKGSKDIDLSKNFSLKKIKVNGLIHCAGINNPKTYKKVTYETLNHLFNINTFSFIELIKQLDFYPNSNIIAIGSLYSEYVKELRLEYSMSKHALNAAVKTLALELAHDKVLVNMISPGFVDTPLTRKNLSDDELKSLNEKIPLGLTSAESISSFIHYMISNNKSITGQNIFIDNGYTLI